MPSGPQTEPNIPSYSLPDFVVRQSDAVLQKMKQRHPDVDLSKFEEYRASFNYTKEEKAHGEQRPFMGYYPGLTAKPFWEPSDSELTAEVARVLEEAAPRIRAEYVNMASPEEATAKYTAATRYSSLAQGDWSGSIIYKDGRFTDVSKMFPEASAAVEKLTDYIVGEAVILVLKPGVVLPSHTDATNAQLTCHLGLVVPEGSGIKVGDEERKWIEGGSIFFDHSYVHTAWNRGDHGRVVLLLNLRHPDISAEEHDLHEKFKKELRRRVILRMPAVYLRRALRKVAGR